MAPTITFSSTVRFWNGRTIWCVRTTPARTARRGDPPLITFPSRSTRPEVGGMDPAIMLNRVVFPAPLGPMTPRISPSFSSRSTESTALRPPNRFETPSARRMTVTVRRLRLQRRLDLGPQEPETARDAEEEAHHAQRLEEDDHDQQHAVDPEVQLRIGPDQVLPQHDEHHGAERGSDDGPHASDHGHEHEGDAAVESEHVAGLDEVLVAGVERAADADGEAGEQEDDVLHQRGRDAHVGGRVHVALDGEQAQAQGGLAQGVRAGDHGAHQRQGPPVQLALEAGGDRQRQPGGAAGQVLPVGHDQPGRLADADGGDGEVRPAEPQRGMAPDERVARRDQAAHDPGDPEREVQREQQPRGDEPAQPEHGRVAEAHLPQVPAHPVPGQRRGDEEERLGDLVLRVHRPAEDLGQHRADRQGGDQRRQRGTRHPVRQKLHPSTRWPKRPPGLSTSTKTRRTNPTAPVRYEGSARMANTSTSARMSAAAAVPITLPSPPSTTITKDLSKSPEPYDGLKENSDAPRRPASPARAVPMPKVSE